MSPRALTASTPLLAGRGLHTGAPAQLQIAPADEGSGIRFCSRDEPETLVFASLAATRASPRRTSLVGAIRVSTVEHLLAALWGLGIHDATVRVTGSEIPIFDGSAAPFCSELLRVSEPSPRSGHCWEVVRMYQRRQASAWCQLRPAQVSAIECEIDFAHPAIGRQRARLPLGDPELFLTRFAPARTFGLVDERSALRAAGLARGASLRNVLVYDARGPRSPTRFTDEPVRHKVVDALGGLALLGGPFQGELRLCRCSHVLLLVTLRGAVAEGALVRRPSS